MTPKKLINRRPQNYHEWRELWWCVCRSIGMGMTHQMENPNRRGRLTIERWMYYETRRAARINQHMEAEFEAQTTSAMTALLDMIFEKDGGADGRE